MKLVYRCSLMQNLCFILYPPILKSISSFLLISVLFITNVYPDTRIISGSSVNNYSNADDPNPSEWLLCGTNSWEDLKSYLPEAKSAGISISVMVLPPYQSDPFMFGRILIQNHLNRTISTGHRK